MKVIFHKISKMYPNSIKGLKHSIELGYRKFELDIRKCKDTFVLHHDAIKDDKYISQENLNKLGELDTLSDFIIEINKYSGLEIFFDIKGTDISIVDFFKDNIKNLNFNNKLFFQSFNLEIIQNLKATDSKFNCGFIVSGYRPISNNIIKELDYICIEEEFVGKYTEYNIDKYLWTVNSGLKKTYYHELGIKGIITDYPKKFT